MLTKIREALEWARSQSEGFGFGPYPLIDEARAEADDVERLVRDALALKVWTVAGLSAFHGRLCSEARDSGPINPDASRCTDPKCRSWAAAVKGETP